MHYLERLIAYPEKRMYIVNAVLLLPVHFNYYVFFCSFREELEKQRARAHYMRLQEEGKTEQARKDLGEGLRAILSTIFTFGAHDYDDI